MRNHTRVQSSVIAIRHCSFSLLPMVSANLQSLFSELQFDFANLHNVFAVLQFDVAILQEPFADLQFDFAILREPFVDLIFYFVKVIPRIAKKTIRRKFTRKESIIGSNEATFTDKQVET